MSGRGIEKALMDDRAEEEKVDDTKVVQYIHVPGLSRRLETKDFPFLFRGISFSQYMQPASNQIDLDHILHKSTSSIYSQNEP